MSYWEAPGKSEDWHTPKRVFDALDCYFDMDVAAPVTGPLHVPCVKWIFQNSLAATWEGFVWMNPPFGGRNGLDPWLNKFFEHGNGIALVPDRTSAPWFQRAWQKTEVAIFTPKIRFLRADGSEGRSPSNGTALLGVELRARAALHKAHRSGLGVLAFPNSARFALAEAAD